MHFFSPNGYFFDFCSFSQKFCHLAKIWGHSLANQNGIRLTPIPSLNSTIKNQPPLKIIMKLSLLPFSLIASVPAFPLVGLGAIPALSLITVLGTLSMLMRDYNSESAYQRELSQIQLQQNLPLAA